MTNQQLKAHCEDVIANPQDHLDWVVDMARVALASLEAVPVYQFIVNNPDHDGYIEWADCNPDYYSKEPSDRRRILYTAQPVSALKLPGISELINLSEYLPAVRDVTLWDACINEVKRLNGVKS